jgi:hypothetical protein
MAQALYVAGTGIDGGVDFPAGESVLTLSACRATLKEAKPEKCMQVHQRCRFQLAMQELQIRYRTRS